MFCYLLEFHDLDPESILHISSFIIVCEAFLHVTPHFGLWLKTFNGKTKMIEGRHVECGGAIISRNANAPWPEGSFPEVSDVWQRRWFYVTTPRGTKWVAAPEFRSGPPSQLASWTDVGRNWGPTDDVPVLQNCIRELLERDINLVSIIQAMLIRRMLPCKRRPLRMWEFNPEGPRTVKHFFDLKLEGMCKLFFGPKVECPDTIEDAGLSCNRLDTQVSNLKAGHPVYICHNHYSKKPSMARNGSTRRRESGVRRHFLKVRLVQPSPRCLAECSAKSP